MFGKKKVKPQIDKEQLELIQNAQRRVRQKKRLYIHFVVFLIFSLALFTLNVGLGFYDEDEYKIASQHWSVIIIIAWFVLLLWHTINVFVFNKFMGKAWEKAQLDKLVSKQQVRIEQIKSELKKEAPRIAESQVYNEELTQKNNNLTIIVAAGENNEIGKDNQLIWHLSKDLKRFKSLTSGHHIIMGRKTFESFPKPLPNRTHVVITRQDNYVAPEGVIIVSSLEKAIEASKNDKQPYIIGGGQIYKQAMDLASKIEITRVHATFDADTFFPEIDTAIWKQTENIFNKKDDKHEYEFSFLTYERK